MPVAESFGFGPREWQDVAGCRDCPGPPKAGVGKPAAHREAQLLSWAAKAPGQERPLALG